MTPQEQKDTIALMGLICKLQSVIHSIDQLSCMAINVQMVRMKTNQYLNFIEPIVRNTGNFLDPEHSEMYVELVKRIDDLCEEITLNEETVTNLNNPHYIAH